MFIVHATVVTTVNYYRYMFIVQATVVTTVNYYCSKLIVQATVVTTVEYYRNMFIVQGHSGEFHKISRILTYNIGCGDLLCQQQFWELRGRVTQLGPALGAT
jgi:hypothetical protein